ncbi:MAG: hypothetical protein ACOY0T_13020 [Myxococcota bacterium]
MAYAGLASLPALATPSAQLRYLRDEGALQCPNENAVRAAVSTRLGYDPFQNDASRIVRVSIETTPDGFRARVELEGGTDAPAVRELTTRGNCAELISAVALSISLAVDAEHALEGSSGTSSGASAEATPTTTETVPAEAKPEATPKPEPPKARATPPPPTSRAELPPDEEPDSTRPSSEPTPSNFETGAHLHMGFGSAPSPSVGGSLFLAARRGVLSVSLALRGDLPAGTQLTGSSGIVESNTAAGELSPCLHYREYRACGLSLLGKIWARSQSIAVPASDSGTYAALGVRLGFAWPRNSVWAFSAQADALALMTPFSIAVDAQPVWSAPSAFVTLGAGALVRF